MQQHRFSPGLIPAAYWMIASRRGCIPAPFQEQLHNASLPMKEADPPKGRSCFVRVGAASLFSRSLFSIWACPIHLTGTHLPQYQRRTSAKFWRGRIISFSLRGLLPFAPIARSPERAGGTHLSQSLDCSHGGMPEVARPNKVPHPRNHFWPYPHHAHSGQ